MKEEIYKAIEVLLRSDDTVTIAQRESILAATQPTVGKTPSVPLGESKPRYAVGYIRAKEAAAYMGVSTRTVSDWKAKSIIPYHKIARKVCLYRKVDLDKAIGRFRHNAVDE